MISLKRMFVACSIIGSVACASVGAPVAASPEPIGNLGMEEADPGGKVAQWQQMGAVSSYRVMRDLDEHFEGAASLRLSSTSSPGPTGFGGVVRRIDAGPYRGKRIRLRGTIQAKPNDDGWAGLWLRVDRPGGEGFFDNMADRRIQRVSWTKYEISGDVAKDATFLSFGLLLAGEGIAWLDDVSLEIIGEAAGPDRPKALRVREILRSAGPPRPKPVAGDVPAKPLTKKARLNLTALARAYGYLAHFDATDEAFSTDWAMVAIAAVPLIEKADGDEALASSLNSALGPHAPDFCAFPIKHPSGCPNPTPTEGPGVAWVHRGRGIATDNVYRSTRERLPTITADRLLTINLGQGVMARIRTAAVLDANGATTPRASRSALKLGKPPGWVPAGFDRSTRLADVIVAWALYKHFYPYFDVIKTDWEAQLGPALERAATDVDDQAFLRTLRTMLAGLQDGHADVAYTLPPVGGLPLSWDWVGDRLVVTAVAADVSGVQRGDIVETLDGAIVAQRVNERMSMISGSPQWRRRRAIEELRSGDPTQSVAITVLRGGRRFPARIAYGKTFIEPRPETMSEVRPGVLYIDLSRTSGDQVVKDAARIATAKSVIFDLRGYPSGRNDFLSHLSDSPFESMPMRVPVITRPDRTDWNFEENTWKMGAKEPRFPRAVFLTDSRAISYAESILATVKGNRLGTIVGTPTAGANGNISPIPLPGGYVLNSTGMQVLGFDRSTHHVVGVTPDVTVKRTLAGIAAGRDEVLDAGLEQLGAR